MITQPGTLSIDRILTRRRLLRGAAGLAGGLVLARPALATARSSPTAGGTVAEARFIVTTDAITAPTGLGAGITHVVVENQTGQAGVHLLTMLLPPGVTKADVAKVTQAPPNAPVPAWWLTATLVGNPDWPPTGGVSEGYVQYAPGTYAIINIFGGQWTLFTVTTAATTAAAPTAAVQVATKDMNFRGLDKGLPTGRTLLKVTNGDPVAHELAFLQVPRASTEVDAVEEVLAKLFGASQPPAGYKTMPGGSGILSPGVSMWLYVDFAPGAYAAVCFAPDGWNGPPHAMMGMIKVFSVQ